MSNDWNRMVKSYEELRIKNEKLQAQVAVSEDDLRVAEAGIAELQAQVDELKEGSRIDTITILDYSERNYELQAQINHYRKALLHISLTAQNSMSDKAECGRIARAAINGDG